MGANGRIDQVTAKPLKRASVWSPSAPASRLYPTASATRIAASWRVSLIAPSGQLTRGPLSFWQTQKARALGEPISDGLRYSKLGEEPRPKRGLKLQSASEGPLGFFPASA